VTSGYACLGLFGPLARALLQRLTRTSLDNDAFPYLQVRPGVVGDVPALLARVTYVGELGWELYCPTEYGGSLWDTLWDAGRAHGLVAGGYRAIDAMRVEKGYRVWSSDVTPEDTPYEAGTGFAVRLDKEVDFIGRAALADQKQRGPTRRLRCLELADPLAVTLGSEAVRIDGQVLGRVTSGGYGFRVARSLAFAYLPAADSAVGRPVEVEVFGDWVPAVVAPDPYFDPRGTRIRS
jgi:4-methylaminobutanoate oxidase (formaldehyde-forming)